MKEFTKNIIDLDTIGGYTLEQILDNKNCSKDPKYWFNIKGTDRHLFNSSVAESWEYFDPLIDNPIRNTNQIYLRFKDISKFIEPSDSFRRNKYYTSYAENTLAWNKYWDDLEDKCEEGFIVDGVRITGRHFFTINFSRFKTRAVDEYGKIISQNKTWSFLGFIDHQYYLFNELEECLLDGKIYNKLENFLNWYPDKTVYDFELLKKKSFVASKGRRKGWSACIGVGIFNYNFTFREGSMNIIAAYEKNHYKPLLSAIRNTKKFLDAETPWIRVTEVKGTEAHFISGIKTRNDAGVPIVEGYLSEIKAESFKDNPFKSIGESAEIINIEEPGKFDKLLEAFPVSIEPLIRDGEIITGVAIAGGTSGDMEGGGSLGLSEFMYKPEAFGFKSYDNIYEKTHVGGKSGWFIDELWYSPFKISKKELLELSDNPRTKILLDKLEGNNIDTVDRNGNSYRYFSGIILERKRLEKRKINTDSYNKFITQQPLYLSEAFLINESSPFDTATAQQVLSDLKTHEDKLIIEKGVFAMSDSGIQWKIDLSLKHLDEYPYDTKKATNSDGCWVIFERPDSNNTNSWRYISGCDPIDFGKDETASKGTHSLMSTYIIDTVTRNIVAEYIGRPADIDNYYEQQWRGIEFYKASLLYENNLKGLFTYYKNKNKLYLLADEPESLKNKHGYLSNGRTKGFHATPVINGYARQLIAKWCNEEIQVNQDINGNNIYMIRMFYIKSKALLQEMINWNSKGNFDRISGLGAAMILLFEKDYTEYNNATPERDNLLFARLRRKLKSNTYNEHYKLLTENSIG